jgi:hypothetical protein
MGFADRRFIHEDARVRLRVQFPRHAVELHEIMAGASLEQAPPEAGGGAVIIQWHSPTECQPKLLREKQDWEWIQAPASMIAALGDQQRGALRGLVIDPSPGMSDFTLEGEFPQLERLDFRIDMRVERLPPRLRSVTAAVKTERVKLGREWLPRCHLVHFEAYHPVRADCLEAVRPEGVHFVELSACKGAPLELGRFGDLTDLHIKQVRTLKNLDLLRPLQKLEELSLHYQASWENLDALDDLRSLRLVELESCSDKNGVLRAAVERLRSRGVLVRSVFTKSAGESLEAKDF